VSDADTTDLSGLRIHRDAPQGERKAARYTAILIVGLLLALAGVGVFATALRQKPIEVTVARAEALGGAIAAIGAGGGAASEVLTANGYVVARQRASVSTEVAGRLAALFVEEGSRVQQGQILGVLRNDDLKAAVEGAKASLAAAEADLEEERASAHEAGLERKRMETLLQRGLVSQSEFDQAEARAKVAEARVFSAAADVESSRARLQSTEVELQKTFIRAPFAGAVLRKEAEVGEIVSPIPSSGGLTRGAIVTMANLASLEVDVDVNEGYVARATEGMRAEITLDAYPARRYPGRVRQIVPTADRQKATVLVKVAFDSLDARVLPEMGAKVTFLADPRGEPEAGSGPAAAAAVAIPKAAVADREGRAVVFVVEEGRASARSIAPRPFGSDRVAVSSGLSPGELVVVGAPAELRDKARVKTRVKTK
jgi:RND family efflux transporter MFP subunit